MDSFLFAELPVDLFRGDNCQIGRHSLDEQVQIVRVGFDGIERHRTLA